MRTRTRRRWVRSQLQSSSSTPLDLTHEEVLADLDSGWADWEPETPTSDRSIQAA